MEELISSLIDDNTSLLQLKPYDSVEPIKIKANLAKMSLTIKTMIEDLGGDTDDNNNNIIIPLPNITQKSLLKIIDWCIYHDENPSTPISEKEELV
jgi:S-phase kinase-associated protein 1